jgi:DNA-binding NarL/FixJ family response regulator
LPAETERLLLVAAADPAGDALLVWGAAQRLGIAVSAAAADENEGLMAHLARDGLSNPDIGARLFLCPRTVERHLRKVFTKLRISSRRELTSASQPRVWAGPGLAADG